MNRKIDRRTALKVKNAATACACGHVFTSDFAKNLVNGEVVCTNCAMSAAYAKAAASGNPESFGR